MPRLFLGGGTPGLLGEPPPPLGVTAACSPFSPPTPTRLALHSWVLSDFCLSAQAERSCHRGLRTGRGHSDVLLRLHCLLSDPVACHIGPSGFPACAPGEGELRGRPGRGSTQARKGAGHPGPGVCGGYALRSDSGQEWGGRPDPCRRAVWSGSRAAAVPDRSASSVLRTSATCTSWKAPGTTSGWRRCSGTRPW